MNKKVKNFVYTFIIMAVGLILLKYIPMKAYGDTILFDAFMHITVASAILYLLYLIIEKAKPWRIPFFILSATVVFVISVQRIISNAHDDVGLLLGLLLSLAAILIPRWKEVRKKIK